MISRIAKKIKILSRKVLRPNLINIDGIKLIIDKSYFSPHMLEVLYNETYESKERRAMEQYITSDDNVLELGAGVGYISTAVAKKIGSERIFTYEANPHLIPIIQKNYALNNVNPTIIHGILGEKDGSASFYLGRDFWKSSTVKSNDMEIKKCY